MYVVVTSPVLVIVAVPCSTVPSLIVYASAPVIVKALVDEATTTSQESESAAPLDVADMPIEEDVALTASDGIPTVTITVPDSSAPNDSVVADLSVAQTPL